jgi:hypothetical protein
MQTNLRQIRGKQSKTDSLKLNQSKSQASGQPWLRYNLKFSRNPNILNCSICPTSNLLKYMMLQIRGIFKSLSPSDLIVAIFQTPQVNIFHQDLKVIRMNMVIHASIMVDVQLCIPYIEIGRNNQVGSSSVLPQGRHRNAARRMKEPFRWRQMNQKMIEHNHLST